MNKIAFVIAALACFVIIACEKEEKNLVDPDEMLTDTIIDIDTLHLNFILTYDGSPLPMFAGIEHQGYDIFFDKFNLFISDVNIVGMEDEVLLVRDVALLDFNDAQDMATAEQGQTIDLVDVPVGEYKSLILGVGLTPELNATTPSDYSTDHPLANHYWEQWNSYIGLIIEGKIDLDGDGTNEQILTYHIGKDAAFASTQFDHSIFIEDDASNTTVNLQIDVKTLLEGIDIATYPIDHSVKPEVFDIMLENMATSVTLKQE